MSRVGTIVVVCALGLFLAGCIAGTPEATNVMAAGDGAALVLGFWHGMIAPVTFLVSMVGVYHPGLIAGGVRVYQGATVGFSYNLGFCFGLFFWPFFLLWRPRF